MSTVIGGRSFDPRAPPDSSVLDSAGRVEGGDRAGSLGRAGRAFGLGLALAVARPRSRTASAMFARLRVSLVHRGYLVVARAGLSLSGPRGLLRRLRFSSPFLSHSEVQSMEDKGFP